MTSEEKRNIYNAIQNLYNMDKTTWQEVLASLYNLVSDVEQRFEAFEEKFDLMLGHEVMIVIKELFESGQLDEIIQKEVFSNIYVLIDKLENELLLKISDEVGKYSDKIDRLNTALNDKALQKDLEIERKRIDLLTSINNGDIEGNTEILDIRVGADGVKYDGAGIAVREQFKKSNTENLKNKNAIVNSAYREEKEGVYITFNDTTKDIPLYLKGFKKGINNIFNKNNIEMYDGYWQTDTGMMINGAGNYGFLLDISDKVGESITVSQITPTPGDAKYISIFANKPNANDIPIVFDRYKPSDKFKGRSYATVPVPLGSKYLFVWYGSFRESPNIDYYLDTMQIEISTTGHKYVPHDGFEITFCGKNVFSANKDEYYVGDRASGQQLIIDGEVKDNEIRFRGNGGSFALCYYKVHNLIPNTFYTASADITENTMNYNATCYGGVTDSNGTLIVTFEGCQEETMEWYHYVRFTNIQVELGQEKTEFKPFASDKLTIYNKTDCPIELPSYDGGTTIFNNDELKLSVINIKDINCINDLKEECSTIKDVILYKKLIGKSFNIPESIAAKILIVGNKNGKILACRKNVFSANKDEYYADNRPSGQRLIIDSVYSNHDIRFRGNGGSFATCYYKVYNLIPNTFYTASADIIENTMNYNATCYGGVTDSNGTLIVTFTGCSIETMEFYHYVRFTNIQVEIGEKRTPFEPYVFNELNNDKLYAYDGITNILTDSLIEIHCPVNANERIDKIEAKAMNYNTVPVMRNIKGELKSVNEDNKGNLKLYPINKNKVKGRSKYNGNMMFTTHGTDRCRIIDSNGALILDKSVGSTTYNFEKFYNARGELRYCYGTKGDREMKISSGGYFTQNYNIVDENFNPIKMGIKLKAHGTVLEGTSGENHVFVPISDNHYIVSAYTPVIVENIPNHPTGKYKVCNCVVQEIKNDKVIFHWESIDHKEFYDYAVSYKDFTGFDDRQEIYNDYCHLNAVVVDTKDNNFIMSFRHTGIAKINRQTGKVMWLFGRGGRIDFKGMTTEHCGFLQHDVRILKDGSITIFDNYGCSSPHSRVCRYWLDESTMELINFKEYITPRKRSMFMGSAILLDDETETFLICYGGLESDDGSPNRTVLCDEINFSTGEVNFSYENDTCAYKVIKYPSECKY